MPATIRRADLDDPDDAEDVVRLTDAYARDPMGGGQPLPDRVREELVPAMREHSGVEVFLAEVGGEAVGVCTVVDKFSTFAAATTLNVHDIAVLPEHRGAGIGRALLDRVEERARERDCARVNLEVLEDNPARRLYERAGFEAKSTYMVKAVTESGDSYAEDR